MEVLIDPLNDRCVKTVRPPPHKPLDPAKMYPDPSKFTSNLRKSHLNKFNRIS